MTAPRPKPSYPGRKPPYGVFLDWLDRQFTDAFGDTYTSLAGIVAAINSVASSVNAHASRHVRSGADPIDGDTLDIDFVPLVYVRTLVGSMTTDVQELTSHLKGIDLGLADILTKSPLLLPIVAYGGSNITLQLSDAHSLLRMNSSSARTITVPPNSSVAFSLGTVINVLHEGSGTLAYVAGSGVTVRSLGGSLSSAGQYAVQTLIKLDTNNWSLAGGIA